MTPIVQVSHLDKYFDSLHVLRDLDLEIAPREVVCIIGRSGSGKSTLLRCLNFLEQPDFGTVTIDGLTVDCGGQGRTWRKQVHDLRLKTGMVFQSFNLFAHMTALENVIEGPVTVKKMDRAEAIELAMINLEKVGLADKANQYPSRLSGGQQQRVAIARAMLHNPKLIVCDEPTSALDHETGHKVMELLREVAVGIGRALIVVTHDARIFGFADRIAKMDDGRITSIENSRIDLSSNTRH